MSRFSKYNNPRWQQVRREILERDKHTCQICGCQKRLQVHHLFYVGENPWDKPEGVVTDHHLITLCKPCHERVEEVVKCVRMLSGNKKFVSKVERVIKQFVESL